jgi:hypothetical protein
MMMTTTRAASLVALICWTIGAAAQTPAPTVDTARIGPPVGSRVPPIAGVDQFGRSQTLESVSGPNGAMLVFFRSADW